LAVATLGQEVGEQPDGLGVALDGALALVLRTKGPAEAAIQRRAEPMQRLLGVLPALQSRASAAPDVQSVRRRRLSGAIREL
jgi:hypothetical protein